MNRKLIAAILATASASLSIPAFASGYGPDPFYKPSVGAPASQRGQSQLAVAAERVAAERAEAEKGASDATYGGAEQSVSESGARQVAPNPRRIYEGH